MLSLTEVIFPVERNNLPESNEKNTIINIYNKMV